MFFKDIQLLSVLIPSKMLDQQLLEMVSQSTLIPDERTSQTHFTHHIINPEEPAFDLKYTFGVIYLRWTPKVYDEI